MPTQHTLHALRPIILALEVVYNHIRHVQIQFMGPMPLIQKETLGYRVQISILGLQCYEDITVLADVK